VIFIIGNLKRQRTGGNYCSVSLINVPSYQSSWAILIVMQPTLKIPSCLKGISNYKTIDKYINDLQLQLSWMQLSSSKKNVLWLACVLRETTVSQLHDSYHWCIISYWAQHIHCLNLFGLIRETLKIFNTLNVITTGEGLTVKYPEMFCIWRVQMQKPLSAIWNFLLEWWFLSSLYI